MECEGNKVYYDAYPGGKYEDSLLEPGFCEEMEDEINNQDSDKYVSVLPS